MSFTDIYISQLKVSCPLFSIAINYHATTLALSNFTIIDSQVQNGSLIELFLSSFKLIIEDVKFNNVNVDKAIFKLESS